MNKKYILILASLVFSLFAQRAFSVIHINGIDTGPKEYNRPTNKYDAQTLRKMGYAPEKIMGVISPATGSRNIAVIIVNFASSGSNTSGSNTLSSDDIQGFNTTFNYLKNFYTEASYGNLNLNFTFFYKGGTITPGSLLTGSETPYTLTTPMSIYGADTEASLSQLMMDSIGLVNSSTLDSSHFDAVMVAHAGYGNESTNNDGDIWSATIGPFVNSSGSTVPKNGFTDGLNIPAKEDGASPIGVTCHEFGHILGLPDIYSTSGNTQSRVGKWCLMDYGPWVNNGKTPSHPSAWCKKYLGWIQPLSANSGQSIANIRTIQTSSATVYQASVLGNSQEYFLICYSSRSAYNPNPPGAGIEIWHIDEGIIDGATFSDRINSNSVNVYSHNTVGLSPASDTDPGNSPYGGPNDLWPGLKKIFTSPYSDSYTNKPSNINLSNISFSGSTANISLTNINMTSLVSVQSTLNYPNPCGKGYFHPRNNSGIITTFVLNLTKVADNIELSIYNMAGEKVIDLPSSKFEFMTDKSSDYKIIYECDWNGKNASSENVATGIYLYKFKVGNDLKTGKLAVVR